MESRASVRPSPPNVRVVDAPEPAEMAEGVWLLPAPLQHRKTSSDPTAAMVDMATPPGALRIGLGHGSIVEFGGSGDSSNLIPPDRAQSAGLDYLALGDWHGFLTIGDRTAYSGTPEVDRFGREAAGACIAVDVRSGDRPEIRRVETGRYRWLARDWRVDGMEDLVREVDGLRQESSLSDVLLDLRLSGTANLAERVEMISLLEDRIAHELRHFDLDAKSLIAQPTTDDVSRIDVQGALAAVTTMLRARSEGSGTEAVLAGAALERLYVEAMRYDAENAP